MRTRRIVTHIFEEDFICYISENFYEDWFIRGEVGTYSEINPRSLNSDLP